MKRQWILLSSLCLLLGLAGAAGLQFWLENKLAHNTDKIIDVLSQRLNHPVEVGQMRLGWSKFQPVLKITKTLIFDNIDKSPKASIGYVEIKLDWLQLFVNKRISISKLHLENPKLQIQCENIKSCNVLGVQSQANLQDLDLQEFFALLAHQNNLQVSGGEVHLQGPNGLDLLLSNVHFSFHHKNKHYHMKGSATYQSAHAAYIQFNIQTTGDLKNWQTNRYEVQLSTRNLNWKHLDAFLSKPSNIEIENIKSVDIKGTWREGVEQFAMVTTLKDLSYPALSMGIPEVDLRLKYQRENNQFLVDIEPFKFKNKKKELHVHHFKLDGELALQNTNEQALTVKHWQLGLPTGQLEGHAALSRQDKEWALAVKGNLRHLHFLDLKKLLINQGFSIKLNNWLDEALLKGHIEDFVLSCVAGSCGLAFDFENVELQYAKDWPRLQQAKGHFKFRSPDIDIKVQESMVNGVLLEGLSAKIQLQKKAPKVHIQAELVGPSTRHQQLVEAMPLSEVHEVVSTLHPRGDLALNVDFEMDLNDIKQSKKILGTIQFQDLRLRLPQINKNINNAKGCLNFTERHLNGKDIDFDFNGESGVADVDFQAERKPQLTLKWQSSYTIKDSVEVKGQVAYRGQLEWSKAVNDWQLQLYSDLKGAAIQLPPPFQKSEETRWPTYLTLTPKNTKEQQLIVQIPTLLSATLALKEEKISHAHVALGASNAPSLNESPGIYITGMLDALALAPWQAWKAQHAAKSELDLPLHLKLQVNQLQANDLFIDDISLDYNGVLQQLNLTSEALQGRIELPTKSNPILNINLDRWVLEKQGEKRQNDELLSTQLKDVSVYFHCQDFSFNDHRYGRVGFKLLPVDIGHGIHDVEVQGEDYRLQGGGVFEHHQNRTQLSLNLACQNVGKTLKEIGYKASIAHGKGNVKILLAWPGSPLAFESKALDGQVDVHLKEGEIIGINPGVGKLLSLLSINSIQRRLQLNFDDLVKDGLYFDIFKTQLLFAEQKAQTEQILIDGPTARIELQGHLALGSNQLDGMMLVTPKIGSSIPVAAALAMGNPAIGAAFWLFDQATGSKMSELTQYKYKVSGTWDNPKLIEIIEEKEKRRT